MTQTARSKDIPQTANGPLTHAMETLSRLSNRSGEQLQHGLIEASVALTQAAGSLLDEAKSQSTKVAKNAGREIQERPIATTASIVLASAALISLMVNLRNHPEAYLNGGNDDLRHEKDPEQNMDRKKRSKDGKTN